MIKRLQPITIRHRDCTLPPCSTARRLRPLDTPPHPTLPRPRPGRHLPRHLLLLPPGASPRGDDRQEMRFMGHTRRAGRLVG